MDTLPTMRCVDVRLDDPWTARYRFGALLNLMAGLPDVPVHVRYYESYDIEHGYPIGTYVLTYDEAAVSPMAHQRITPEMAKALAAPMPNAHALWHQYLRSCFRRELFKAWAGDDPQKQHIAQDLLNETTPM